MTLEEMRRISMGFATFVIVPWILVGVIAYGVYRLIVALGW